MLKLKMNAIYENYYLNIIISFGYLFLYVHGVTVFESGIACEGQVLRLECPTGQTLSILDSNYGRTTAATCPHRFTANRNCKTSASQAVVSQACNNKRRCEIGANNNIFGDPCVGTNKYLLVQYKCVDAYPCKAEQFQCNDGSCISESSLWDGRRNCPSGEDEAGSDYESEYACEGYTLNINCRRGEIISVINGNYGRFTRKICSHPAMSNVNCKAGNSFNVIKNSCNQKPSCSISSSNGFFGDPCVGTYKYTEVHYQCIKLPNCTTNEFQCNNGHCIHNFQKCDGTWDCLTGEDEHGCDYLTDFACEHSALEIECKIGHAIQIIGANYGRRLNYICTQQNKVDCVSVVSKHKVSERCNGKRTCKINANNGEFGDPCVGTKKYLSVNYQCKSNEVSKEPNPV